MNVLEQKILDLASPIASEMEFSIVDIKVFGKEKITLQIFLEKLDFSSVSIDDCAKFSRVLSVLLDVNDLIEKKYNLEVSSAGINRRISKIEDFQRFVGESIVIKTIIPVQGKKNFKGNLHSVLKDKVYINNEHNQIEEIQIDLIDRATLDLIKDIFNHTEGKQNKSSNKDNIARKNGKQK